MGVCCSMSENQGRGSQTAREMTREEYQYANGNSKSKKKEGTDCPRREPRQANPACLGLANDYTHFPRQCKRLEKSPRVAVHWLRVVAHASVKCTVLQYQNVFWQKRSRKELWSFDKNRNL